MLADVVVFVMFARLGHGCACLFFEGDSIVVCVGAFRCEAVSRVGDLFEVVLALGSALMLHNCGVNCVRIGDVCVIAEIFFVGGNKNACRSHCAAWFAGHVFVFLCGRVCARHVAIMKALASVVHVMQLRILRGFGARWMLKGVLSLLQAVILLKWLSKVSLTDVGNLAELVVRGWGFCCGAGAKGMFIL